MAFESVSQGGAVWEPKQSGSKKDGTLKEKQPTEKSKIEGYYFGSKEVTTKNGASMIHYIKNPKGYDSDDVDGDIIDSKIGVWGNGVLDKMISESITRGQYIQITWLGKAISKSTGNPYHCWDLAVDNTVEPYSGMTPLPAELNAAPVTNGSVAAAMDDDDDSLPF